MPDDQSDTPAQRHKGFQPLSLFLGPTKYVIVPDPCTIRQRLRSSSRICLNVGGTRHEVLWKTIEHPPESRLGRLRRCRSNEDLLELCDDYDLDAMEFYFDRHPVCFSIVLNYYRTGKLHLVDDLCVLALGVELAYWDVNELCLESCCQLRYFQRKEQVFDEMRKDEENTLKPEEEDFGEGCCAKGRQKIWNLMEKPQTSMAARV